MGILSYILIHSDICVYITGLLFMWWANVTAYSNKLKKIYFFHKHKKKKKRIIVHLK